MKDLELDSLDKILVLGTSQDGQSRLASLQQKVRRASWFEDGSPEDLQVARIIEEVRNGGDQALLELTARYDGVELTAERIRVQRDHLADAYRMVDPDLMASIRMAIENVRRYQSAILTINRSTHPGIRYRPIERVGICVPGASAPLPSTVIMTAVPAQVAGVGQIAVVCPPRCNGDIHPVVLAVCHQLGIDEVYRIGGAQAVAALAFGTQSVRPVDKIVGPGNRWVQMAKRKVFGKVGIDSIAGPSEVTIIANDLADPAWVAADMLSQAEHAPGLAILLTDSAKLASQVLEQLRVQLPQLGRAVQTLECLMEFGAIVVFDHMGQVIAAANQIAPEHLQVQCGQFSSQIASKLTTAGAIFIGPYSPAVLGDYWAGPSHTLPTGQTARFFSPLSSNDFIRSMSVIEYTRSSLQAAARDIIRLAQVEGLDAHARSIQIRLSGPADG